MKRSMLELMSKYKVETVNYDSFSKADDEEITKIIKELGSTYNKSNISKIKESLKSKKFGNEILYFEKVDSTNLIAKFLAINGASEGTIILSDVQLKGKGRSGKKWESPPGGIWFSIILKPTISPSKAPLITLATGVAVAKTLKKLGVEAKIKWPNDILINDKKVCGILTEANASHDFVDYVVVGIGIDTNLNLDTLPPLIKERSTTLKNELKHDINNVKVITEILSEFEITYEKLQEEKFDEILHEWRNLSQTIGNYVEIKQPLGKILEGHAVGIDNSGALIIESSNGELKKIISGECALKN